MVRFNALTLLKIFIQLLINCQTQRNTEKESVFFGGSTINTKNFSNIDRILGVFDSLCVVLLDYNSHQLYEVNLEADLLLMIHLFLQHGFTKFNKSDNTALALILIYIVYILDAFFVCQFNRQLSTKVLNIHVIDRSKYKCRI